MARYIDADLLKTDYYALPKSLSSLTVSTQYVSMFQILNTPTADVVERKRGKWIAVKIGNGDTRYTCSECGASYECDSRDAWDFNFCPNCGSEMKGDKNE